MERLWGRWREDEGVRGWIDGEMVCGMDDTFGRVWGETLRRASDLKTPSYNPYTPYPLPLRLSSSHIPHIRLAPLGYNPLVPLASLRSAREFR
jgi:hypothetical protein